MSPTQATVLVAFVQEYLTHLSAQIRRGAATPQFGVPMNTRIRTRDALIRSGYLECSYPGERRVLAPTRKALDWWMGPRAGFIAARDAR